MCIRDRDKGAPHAGLGALHGHTGFPAGKAAAHLHGGGTGGPDRKPPARGTVRGRAGMCAQNAVGVEAVSIERAETGVWSRCV